MGKGGLPHKVVTGGPSPELTANVFTYFTYEWLRPFINLGNKKPIQHEDLYDLLPREKTEYCERIWNKCWHGQIKDSPGKQPSVWRLVYVSAGREMVWSFMATPIWLSANIAQVFLLRSLVEVAEKSDEHLPWWRGFMLVFGMLISANVQSLAQHFTFNSGFKSGMKIKSAMSMAVFNKVVIARGVGAIRKRSVKLTDARVRTIQEILSGVRVVKFNGWTIPFLERIKELRSVEMRWIRKASYLRASTSALRDSLPPTAALVTFATYGLVHGGQFSASTAFTILSLYSVLVRVYVVVPQGAMAMWEATIGLQRLQTLLNLPNGNGTSSKGEMEPVERIYPDASVAFLEGTFTWYLKQDENTEANAHIAGRIHSSIPNREKGNIAKGSSLGKPASDIQLKDKQDGFKLATLKDISMAAYRGQLVGVIGSVGSGKSSLLNAILGEMECVKGWSLLDGTVSYAPQQPWILNDTVKNNILFGSEYDEDRYNATVFACALVHDIKNMPAGDDTEIGERGINVSGGQKARLSLARACYRSSEVVLLDDPLAAVDVPTARHLMKHVLDDILKGRLVILVTHNKASLELCDKVFLMENGTLREVAPEEDISQETPSGTGLPECGEIAREVDGYEGDPDEDSLKDESLLPRKTGSLTVQEDRVLGQINYKTYIDYCKGSGLWLWAAVFLAMGFGQGVRVMVDFWLSLWVGNKFHRSPNFYLGSYALLITGLVMCSLSRSFIFTEATFRAAKSMHRLMTESVLRSPQLFFDQNPVGRIMNRFSKDQSMVDELLPLTAQNMFENLVAVCGALVLVGIIMPWFLLSLPPFLLVLWYVKRRYVAVSREVKRLDGLSRSPIYAHFTQCLQGVTSVRAYGVETSMHDRFRELIDANNRANILFFHASRWLGVRLDFVASCCLTTSSLLSILLRHQINSGLIGVVLVQSLQITGVLQYGVRLVSDTENIFTSVERNLHYAKLLPESSPKSPPGLIGDEWPENGKVEFVDLTMAYRVDLQSVLNNLTFTVHPQEKVGILGRTGAGKSSIAAALFRMVENSKCSGSIFIDGIDIKLVGLDDLRLRLSIIPQDPVLFRGTVRLNLDPFHRHSDVEIHEALHAVELTNKIKSMEHGLDSTVSENGENFSVGQRQLLCLARSLLRKSKIIVMDEATAAVDGETDQLIQKTMKTVFRDCTVLTIAHRIDTVIDCDRVLVLAKGGRIVEFDSPLNLLKHAEQVNSQGNSTSTQREHCFANMVSKAGPTIAKRLREAAEVAEARRRSHVASTMRHDINNR